MDFATGHRLRVTFSRYCVFADIRVVRIQAARLDVIYRVCNKISHVTYISSRLLQIYCDPRHYRDMQLRPFPANNLRATNLHLVRFEAVGLEMISPIRHRDVMVRRAIGTYRSVHHPSRHDVGIIEWQSRYQSPCSCTLFAM